MKEIKVKETKTRMNKETGTGSVRLDKTGICINGEYRVLLASSLFYFRIPKERWDDRMRLLKAAGYTAIDVYFPWNYHETAPGIWDFEGNRDVERFLQLAASHDLYVIARPGPYICSEWDGGAIPAWLWEKGIRVRQDDPGFLKEMESWYKHILPILSKYQIDRQGTVICMQIENELDFYSCVSPVSYMEKLKNMAEKMGITAPLFYCCGQNDLLRGGGLTPGLYTAFNVYSGGENEAVEERALHLYRSVQERDMPFLVTETNREHSYLKRLLSCGARLLGPYNQTAGCTMDFYNGITNWGTRENPVAFMASDYDFQSMIGSAGEVNEEFFKARLFAGLIGSLKESLAKAQPSAEGQVTVCSQGKVNSIVPALVMSEGRLLEISNLERAGEVRIQAGEDNFSAQMEEMETRLLPWHFRVSKDCEIIYSSYEIGWIDSKGGETKVCLYGTGRLECLLSGPEGEQKLIREETGEPFSFSCGGTYFTAGSPKAMASGHVPGLPDFKKSSVIQKNICSAEVFEKSGCALAAGEERKAPVQPMEKLGQYRGIGCYRTGLSEDGEYLFAKAADLLTFCQGKEAETVFSDGGCVLRELEKGELRLYTEIWGHSNFDDVRCESLQMGSLKGIEKIVKIDRMEDISEGWLFDLDEGPWEDTCFFRHSPYNTIMGIDSYNRAVTPLKTIYTRYIQSEKGEDGLFLHFEKAECMIGVYVNNRYVGMVRKNDPYVDLSGFAGTGRIELTLRLLRRYYSDPAGRVTLLGGRKIPDCYYAKVHPEPLGNWEACSLPYEMKQGENSFLRLSLKNSAKNVKLFFKGQDMKLTVYAGGHTAGRLLLQEEAMPAVAGGRREVVCLCGEWCRDVEIWCQATGLRPVLYDIEIREYEEIV